MQIKQLKQVQLKRLEVGEGDAHYAATPVEHYRAVYFEAFNFIL